MPSGNKVGIVVVAYNNPTLILKQMQCIKKFCADDRYDIIIVDNSDTDNSKGVQHHTMENGGVYIRTVSGSSNGSDSHAFACNTSYFKLKDYYDYLFYLDHDNFPVKEFSVIDVLGDNVITGLTQHKSKIYYWPGCVMFNNSVIPHDLINFSVSHEMGLDTGGLLCRVIEAYDSQCGEFNEVYHENPHFPNTIYSFYAMINDGMFMHFINSSNWNPIDNNEQRVNSLYNILFEKTGI